MPLDAEIEMSSPVILDPDFSHGIGNLTSKSLTQGNINDTICLPGNNDGEPGQNLQETEGQTSQDSTGHLPFSTIQ